MLIENISCEFGVRLLNAVAFLFRDGGLVVGAISRHCNQRASIISESAQRLPIRHLKLRVAPLAVEVLRQQFLHK